MERSPMEIEMRRGAPRRRYEVACDTLAWQLLCLANHMHERKYHCAHTLELDVSRVRRLRKLLMRALRRGPAIPLHDRFADTDAAFCMDAVGNCVRDSIVVLRAVQDASREVAPMCVFDEEFGYLDGVLRYARSFPVAKLCRDLVACGGVAAPEIG